MSSSSRSAAIPDGTVLTFGLNEEQNASVRAALPTKGYVLNDSDVVTAFQYYTELDNSACEDGGLYFNPFPHSIPSRYQNPNNCRAAGASNQDCTAVHRHLTIGRRMD